MVVCQYGITMWSLTQSLNLPLIVPKLSSLHEQWLPLLHLHLASTIELVEAYQARAGNSNNCSPTPAELRRAADRLIGAFNELSFLALQANGAPPRPQRQPVNWVEFECHLRLLSEMVAAQVERRVVVETVPDVRLVSNAPLIEAALLQLIQRAFTLSPASSQVQVIVTNQPYHVRFAIRYISCERPVVPMPTDLHAMHGLIRDCLGGHLCSLIDDDGFAAVHITLPWCPNAVQRTSH